MGLAVQIGLFADTDEDPEWGEELRETLKRLNEILVANGRAPHEEPEDAGVLIGRAACDSFPYPFLHYLRRVYAHVQANPRFIASPLPEDQDPCDDPVLEAEYSRERSHLLCHSDCEGYYVPQDFEAVVICSDEEVPGGMVGSSFRLRDELVEIAPALGVRLSDGELSDAEAERINEQCEADTGPFRERMVWMALYEAARISIERQVAIEFT